MSCPELILTNNKICLKNIITVETKFSDFHKFGAKITKVVHPQLYKVNNINSIIQIFRKAF